jgi:tetratricopeptide (TPR) repeat protein
MPRKTMLSILLLPWVALPLLCQTASSSQDEVELHLHTAQQYLAEKKLDLAIPELEKVVALDPGNVDAQGNLGVVLFFRGNYKEAVPHLRIAVGKRSDIWKIQALLGLAEGRLHEDSASRADMEAAFPHLTTEEKVQLDVGKALIDNYTATGDLDKAAATVSELLVSRPADTFLLYLSYRIYSDLSNRAMLTMALTAPGSAEMHEVMAHELAQHGDDAPAIANYREAIRINPQLPGLHFELGDLLYHSSDDKLRAEASSEFQAALAVNPANEKAQLSLGVIAAKSGDLKTAFADDSRALQLDPNDTDAYIELGKVLERMNQRDKAQQMFERVIQIDPTNYMAHYHLATFYRQQGRAADMKVQIDQYLKYKQMKGKLEEIFHDMRVASGQHPAGDDDSTQ